ncbi:unnamed protein product [Choristocarpus tenellus]
MAISVSPVVEVLRKDFSHSDNGDILCNESIDIKFDGKILHLSQVWENGEELAPIFSGACWAGTVVWQAALDLCNYVSKHLRDDLPGATVVELGAGIGVPGMIARLLGAKVVLTEQDELLSLMQRNIDANFFGDKEIRCKTLDWGRAADTDDLLDSLVPTPSTTSASRVTTIKEVDDAIDGAVDIGELGVCAGEGRGDRCLDLVLCADCVYEPLYGNSWKTLVQVMRRLGGRGTRILTSVERRNKDGVPEFLQACRNEGFDVRQVWHSVEGAASVVEIHELHSHLAQAEHQEQCGDYLETTDPPEKKITYLEGPGPT